MTRSRSSTRADETGPGARTVETARCDIVYFSSDAEAAGLLRQALDAISANEELYWVSSEEQFLAYVRTRCRSAGPASWRGPLLVLIDLHPVQPLALQALARLRSDSRMYDVPVVVLLVETEHYLARDCSAAGANSCVDRPQDTALLKDLFALVLDYWTRWNDVPGRHQRQTVD